MSKWPIRYEQCQNCGCDQDRRAYGARGYCSRCYHLVRRIEEIKTWDRTRSETLTSPAQALPRTLTDEEFEIARKELIRQADRHLGYKLIRRRLRRCSG
jgi:hypothetical protein